MSMEKWRKNIIASNGKLVEAIKKIDDSGIQLVLVANSEGYLEGILTDGDVRRAILKGKFLDIPVEEVMNRNPRTVLENASREEILAIMRRYTMHHLPMLDSSGKILKLFTLDELIGAVEIPNWVVLMAGGLGKRYNSPKLKFYIGDVRDSRAVASAMRGVDYIFHAAALKQVPSCEFHPMQAVRTNVLGTENVLEAAIEAKVKRVEKQNFIAPFLRATGIYEHRIQVGAGCASR